MSAYVLGIVLFALGIAATIALHEAGHMLSARAFGMRVRRFFIGFGPTVLSVRKGHTQYGLAAVPLGGFCDIAGMTAQDPLTPEEAPYAMVKKPWWQRIIVLSGGVIVNIIVGLSILYGLAVSGGLPNPNADYSPRIGGLSCVADQIAADNYASCSGPGPAQEAGLELGDKILAFDQQEIEGFAQLRDSVFNHPGETVEISVERDGQRLDIPVTIGSVLRIGADGTPVTAGAIGAKNAPVADAYIAYGPVEAVGASALYARELLSGTVQGLISLPAKIPGVVSAIFGAERDVEGPMSVVGASRVGGEFAERSLWNMFWLLLASLNFFLALFNLVPLPPLDGGHIAVVLYEKVRDGFRRLRGLAPAGPADYTKLMPVTYVMAGLLLGLGVIVILADVLNPVQLFG